MEARTVELGRYRRIVAAERLPEAFPEVERAARAAMAGRGLVEFRIDKRPYVWTITAYDGWSGGGRVDLTPVSDAFGPAAVEVAVYRWSRVSQAALYVALAAGLAAFAAVWLGAVPGARDVPVLGVPVLAVLAGVAFACLGGAVSFLCMQFGGGRLSDAQLIAIGEAIAAALVPPGPADAAGRSSAVTGESPLVATPGTDQGRGSPRKP